MNHRILRYPLRLQLVLSRFSSWEPWQAVSRLLKKAASSVLGRMSPCDVP